MPAAIRTLNNIAFFESANFNPPAPNSTDYLENTGTQSNMK
jgi:hypothetical protein